LKLRPDPFIRGFLVGTESQPTKKRLRAQSGLNSFLLAALLAIAAIPLAGCGPAKNKFEKEVENEALAVGLAREVAAGQYDLITAAELKELLTGDTDLLIVDTMPYEASFQKAHVPGAKHFLFPKERMHNEWDSAKTGGKSQEDYEQLLGADRERLIVVYCGYVKCARSHNAALWARRMGYTNVKRFPGGIFAWKGAGYASEAGG
jgi:rhodanese-related sulfurtransferase